jgi:hypothetical protein
VTQSNRSIDNENRSGAVRSQFLKVGSRFINLAAVAYMQRVDAGIEVHFIGVSEHILVERDEDVRALLGDIAPDWTADLNSH